MSNLEIALTRLNAALGQLESKVKGAERAQGATGDLILQAERDALMSKVRVLEAKSAEEAQLRGEAAQAVRAALSDLRAMAANEGTLNG